MKPQCKYRLPQSTDDDSYLCCTLPPGHSEPHRTAYTGDAAHSGDPRWYLDGDERADLAERRLDVAMKALEKYRKFVTCEECGEDATAMYFTEGDGTYWLCGSMDDDHTTKYLGIDPICIGDPLAEIEAMK